ncbi:hypothetical protein BJF78_10630 [Pseudonocardia sp. CNS-139]|nr:hypothetical protein BJF78_10630 [Pseudonocardia sp. CNS-139]
MDPATWPHSRSSHSAVLARFGADRAGLAGRALTTGDPPADAVVEEIHAGGKPVRDALATGVRDGLAAVADPPPAVAALLAQAEATPAHVDDDQVKAGCEPYFSSHPASRTIALSAGALVNTYSSPHIAAVLTGTGRLVEAADRRLLETGVWLNAAMLPGGLHRGAPGYVATLQVRMLHAHVRRHVRAHGFDEAAHGVPVNQMDLTRTWLDFTLTSYRAEQAMGFERTPAEIAAVYRYWWHVGHLLGIDPRIVEGIGSHEAATRLDALVDAVTGRASAASAALADASLDSVARLLQDMVGVPVRVGRPVLDALTRRFLGGGAADDLGLPRPALDVLLPPGIAAVRWRHRRRRADPDAWRQVHESGMARARGLVANPGGPTEFQTA